MQSRSQQKLAVAKRSMAIVPFDLTARHFDDAASASDTDNLRDSPDLVAVRARVHPQSPADSPRNTAQALYASEAASARIYAQSRQRVTGADGNALAIEMRFALQFFERDDDVMMIG